MFQMVTLVHVDILHGGSQDPLVSDVAPKAHYFSTVVPGPKMLRILAPGPSLFCMVALRPTWLFCLIRLLQSLPV